VSPLTWGQKHQVSETSCFFFWLFRIRTMDKVRKPSNSELLEIISIFIFNRFYVHSFWPLIDWCSQIHYVHQMSTWIGLFLYQYYYHYHHRRRPEFCPLRVIRFRALSSIFLWDIISSPTLWFMSTQHFRISVVRRSVQMLQLLTRTLLYKRLRTSCVWNIIYMVTITSMTTCESFRLHTAKVT
jgi:hypothetical protein